MKHTPAPWRVTKWDGEVVGEHRHAGQHWSVHADHNTMICPTGFDEESRANALLIAAAPDLYQVVRHVEGLIAQMVIVLPNYGEDLPEESQEVLAQAHKALADISAVIKKANGVHKNSVGMFVWGLE